MRLFGVFAIDCEADVKKIARFDVACIAASVVIGAYGGQAIAAHWLGWPAGNVFGAVVGVVVVVLANAALCDRAWSQGYKAGQKAAPPGVVFDGDYWAS